MRDAFEISIQIPSSVKAILLHNMSIGIKNLESIHGNPTFFLDEQEMKNNNK